MRNFNVCSISFGKVFLTQSYQSTEVASKTDMRESEHNDGAMTLSEALASINAKEELVKQHIKVAEEAVSGNMSFLIHLFQINKHVTFDFKGQTNCY